jgi:hypothetical protein
MPSPIIEQSDALLVMFFMCYFHGGMWLMSRSSPGLEIYGE